MGFAIAEGGALARENKLIGFEPFTTLCKNPTLHSVGKVVWLRRNPRDMIRGRNRTANYNV